MNISMTKITASKKNNWNLIFKSNNNSNNSNKDSYKLKMYSNKMTIIIINNLTYLRLINNNLENVNKTKAKRLFNNLKINFQDQQKMS